MLLGKVGGQPRHIVFDVLALPAAGRGQVGFGAVAGNQETGTGDPDQPEEPRPGS